MSLSSSVAPSARARDAWEFRSPASISRLQKLALAAGAAIAVFGSVSVVSAAPKTHSPANGTALVNLMNTRSDAAGPLELGDTIVLTAGANYDISLMSLPQIDVGVANAYITIQTSNLAGLPAADVRATSAHAGAMPKLRTTTGNPAFTTAGAPSAPHHYKFVGVEITSSGTQTVTSLVRLGRGDSTQNTTALVPHHFIFDRCYVHAADRFNQPVRRGIENHTGYIEITNCTFEGIKETGTADSQAIAGWNGTGPVRIINNYIEAASESIMYGGANTFVPNAVTSDIEIRRNHFSKPIEWRSNWRWSVKNLFEFKTARRITLDSNVFENCWSSRYGQQHGVAISFKTITNGDAWKTSEDTNFRNNIVRNCAMGFTMEGHDQGTLQGVVRNVTINNNIIQVDHLNWAFDTVVDDPTTQTVETQFVEGSTGTNGAAFWMVAGPENVNIFNNTVINSAYLLGADHAAFAAIPNFKYYNNITRKKDPAAPYGGYIVPTQSNPTSFFNAQMVSPMMKHNAFMAETASQYLAPYDLNQFPTSSTTWANVLKNYPGGNVNDNFSAFVGAPYNLNTYGVDASGNATNKPIGPDANYINNIATLNVTSGTPKIGADDILLYASKTTARVGTWAVTADTSAAGGAYIGQPDAGVPKITTPSAAPANYFEIQFFAKKGVAYHIWARGRAINDYFGNDSAYIQFNNSVDSAGTAMWRIGTTGGTPLFLEEGSGAGLQGWGWNDNAYNVGEVPPMVYFSTTGIQTLRIQQREDGYQIDQIMLTPVKYMNTRPGLLKLDTLILPEQNMPQFD